MRSARSNILKQRHQILCSTISTRNSIDEEQPKCPTLVQVDSFQDYGIGVKVVARVSDGVGAGLGARLGDGVGAKVDDGLGAIVMQGV